MPEGEVVAFDDHVLRPFLSRYFAFFDGPGVTLRHSSVMDGVQLLMVTKEREQKQEEFLNLFKKKTGV